MYTSLGQDKPTLQVSAAGSTSSSLSCLQTSISSRLHRRANCFLTTLVSGRASLSTSLTTPAKPASLPPWTGRADPHPQTPCPLLCWVQVVFYPKEHMSLNDSLCLQRQMDLTGPQWPTGQPVSSLSTLSEFWPLSPTPAPLPARSRHPFVYEGTFVFTKCVPAFGA